uniref:Uncharacterized protein n=1 Tax=Hucho hucho TaxID=62062 RepID=A0A4W5NR90_9TELE
MDKKKKQYAGTLVDLKAELYRKQEQFKHETLGQDRHVINLLRLHNNEGVSARAQKDVEQVAEEENNLDKKRKLHEQMTKEYFPGIVL